jgi:hypothetical protein
MSEPLFESTAPKYPVLFWGAFPRRALAAISPIVDSSERGDSQNVDRDLGWLGHAYRFALGRWIGSVVTDGRDTRGSRVPRRHHVPAPGGQLCLLPKWAIAQRFCAALPHRRQ